MRALETFKALGIDFVSYSEQMDTSTPAGKMVFTVLGAVAELERSLGSTHAANPCNEGSDGTWTCALTLSTGIPGRNRLEPLYLEDDYRRRVVCHLRDPI
jgi:hypothetical protein